MILNEAPEGARVLDIEALRKVRAEARAAAGVQPAVIKLSAGYIQLAAEIPIEAAFAFQAADIRGGLAGMLADPSDLDELLAAGVTSGDIEELTKFLDTSLGESSASA